MYCSPSASWKASTLPRQNWTPRDTSLDLAIHNRTISLDMGRLSGWFESHHGLGGCDKRLDMSQKARVAKDHELPRVVSYQRSRVTKGCELPKGVSNQRAQVAKGYEHQEVVSDPYGSVYDLLSQDMVHGLSKPGKSRMELRMVLVKPRSLEGSVSERLCNVWLDDARDELVIVYETVKKLCIASHVSK
ncbi:hypothetical protein F2Q70_00022496 [Brassica cretica]|uniref:Uncharacterized protein n=1 Tax=Brassica cretica TaxID=69181 RepID=A0A8S9GVX3_BRACR|nr:hypothetical protein F2Q70_00022496 [Brassica cretica]